MSVYANDIECKQKESNLLSVCNLRINLFIIWELIWRGDKRWITWEATKLLRTVIFPIRLSLRTVQQHKQFRIFSIFSTQLSLAVISGSVDSQTPSALIFVFCQLKSLSGRSFSLLPAQEPIQRASVFLLFSLRPETFSKLCKIFRASESDFSEPSRIKGGC